MNLLDFNGLVQLFAAQARASANAALDFTVGSVFRALAEAMATVGLWLQWLILDVKRQTRLSTSIATEVDSWVTDFGMARLQGVGAYGVVTFSRNSATIAAVVPVGALVKSADGSQSFAVSLDASNPAYSSALGGYLLPVGMSSITVLAVAATTGSATNVQAGTITVLATAIAGVDTVINAGSFSGGLDAESDDALRTRFRLFVDSRSRATKSAVAYAIASARQGLSYSIDETAGHFVVTVDDGTGSPSPILLATIYLAIDAIRPLGTSFSVIAPSVLTATISMTLTPAPGYLVSNLDLAVEAALLAYVDAMPIGAPLAYARLAQIALNVTGVANATSILLNGGTADIGGAPGQVVRATSASVVIS